MNVRQIKIFTDVVTGKMASQQPQQVAFDLQLFPQRRQRRLGLRHQRFLREHVSLRGAAEFEFVAHNGQLVALVLYQLQGRGNLTAQRSLLNRGGDHVGRQSEIRRFQLKALVILLRPIRFYLPSDAAEYVERVGNADTGVEKVVGRTEAVGLAL